MSLITNCWVKKAFNLITPSQGAYHVLACLCPFIIVFVYIFGSKRTAPSIQSISCKWCKLLDKALATDTVWNGLTRNCWVMTEPGNWLEGRWDLHSSSQLLSGWEWAWRIFQCIYDLHCIYDLMTTRRVSSLNCKASFIYWCNAMHWIVLNSLLFFCFTLVYSARASTHLPFLLDSNLQTWDFSRHWFPQMILHSSYLTETIYF